MKRQPQYRIRLHAALVVAATFFSITAHAQTAEEKLHALTLKNERMYRELSAMDDKGSSYAFTNVTAWKITDDDLKNQIIKVYQDKYKDKQLKNFDIDNVYVFAAPTKGDRYEPFHILFMGKHVNVDTSGGGEDIFFGGGRKRSNTNASVPVAFKGREVISVMQHQPALDDNINAIQGELVELPGDIAPRGAQLIKSSDERYIFHEMFTGPYSKRVIVNEQARMLQLPTFDEDMQATVDTTQTALPPEADASASLAPEVLSSRAFRYQPRIDLSIDHLGVNISRQNEVELQLGNPEVGLPFWSSGEARLWLNMRNQIGSGSDFKLGLDFPANLGRDQGQIFQARKLSGFWGGSLAAYFSGIDFFSAFNMPMAFNFSVIPAGGYNSSIIYSGLDGTDDKVGKIVPGSKTFFRTAFIGQMYIPFIVQLNQTNFIQFSAGVGIHQVKLSWIPASDTEAASWGYGANQGGKLQDLIYQGKANVSTPFTPHVAIELVNQLSNKFGLNFQYDHLFTFGGWLELIPDHLRIEASYTAPLVRDAKPYEPPYFFEVTPRIYF
ncbi:MAG: hypothetical protein Q8922_11670 [Bacteroidota bacterium]|nr:hypothetical protein [Bacteroidota bacterium]MDP4234660.1 hypothetical protein [Bacteroidota bacterium]MDP4243825.1 hypothetical protein [Bacteroidota bacterium]MDP4288584.1 hypothetical protein [Bacteroidota bacterium]